MIGYRSRVKSFCCEDISLIENYDKAVNDNEKSYHCHHRLETHHSNGEKRKQDERLSISQLKEMGLYYKRPASELIFLTPSEHKIVHGDYVLGKHWKLSEETRAKISKASLGNTKGIGNKSRKGQKQSPEEIEKRMAKIRGVKNPNKATCKGRSWYLSEEGKRIYK
jgi:hypothetical protein